MYIKSDGFVLTAENFFDVVVKFYLKVVVLNFKRQVRSLHCSDNTRNLLDSNPKRGQRERDIEQR